MKVLELFSGTHSVGKEAKKRGWTITSLDLNNADINIDILEWNYKELDPNSFDLIWASPPCRTFSTLRSSHIGRIYKNGVIYTKESIQKDIETIGLPILKKTEEIIDYFKPKYYFIENPYTGKMKSYIDRPMYKLDYCKYSNFGYRKRTAIWTNLTTWKPRPLCKNDCSNMIGNKHRLRIGMKADRTSLNDRYRIPPILINEILDSLVAD